MDAFCRGYDDCEVVTDCQSWGVLSLGPIGPDGEEFYKSLDWPPDTNDGTISVQDYNESITDVYGFRGSPGENDYIEVDFTEHFAAALYTIGDDANGDFFHNEMGRTVDANGGLFHSFCDQDPNNIGYFINDPSKRYSNLRYNYVGSAAWYYFNEVRLNPLNLRPCFAECRAANIDGGDRVNFLDYAILASDWLEDGFGLAGDLNGDRRVQWVDLNIITRYWLSDCND